MTEFRHGELIYQKLTELFLEKIKSGEWPNHLKLPDEIKLAQDLGVSRGTLRKALNSLVERGLLTHVRGKGTFVQTDGIDQQLASSLISYAEALERQHKVYTTVVLKREIIEPDLRVSSLLGTKPGEQVAMFERVRLVASRPVIYLKNYVPIRLCPNILEQDLEHNKLFDLIERCSGLPIKWGQRYFRAVAAFGDPAFNLGMQQGAPLMYLEQTVFTTSNVPIEHSNVWLDSDRFELMAVLSR